MLSKLGLKNFKLHASTEIEAAPVTVLIGPNNSGKSSILQALLLFRQAALRASTTLCQPSQRLPVEEHYLFPPDRLIDVGEFQHTVKHGENEITIVLAGAIQSQQKVRFAGPTQLQFEVNVRGDQIAYHRGKLEYCSPELTGSRAFSWEWQRGRPPQQASPPVQVSGASLHFQPVEQFTLIQSAGSSYPSNLPPETAADIQELGRFLGGAPSSFLGSFHPIFPLRGLEQWGYPLTDYPPGHLERMTLPDRTIALLNALAQDLELQEKLSRWLEELVQLTIKIQLLPRKRVTLLSRPSDARTEASLFSNEGTGANQLPFILVPIGLTPPGETILLSEPEAHLHPKAQATLVSMLLTIAEKETRQFFIETHSEHVLHSMLHAVAAGRLKREELAIYYFEKKNGVAQCRKLHVDGQGRVEGGLPGFFEHSLAELADYLEALKKN